MHSQRVLAASLALSMCCVVADGKDKKKVLLPADVLQAKTALIVIDPAAGVSPDAPNANRTAQEDVEKAMMKWGRFELVPNVSSADLIITVTKRERKDCADHDWWTADEQPPRSLRPYGFRQPDKRRDNSAVWWQ